MPRRTNVFQEVVAIIQRHLAGEFNVEESDLLKDRLTGREREVDVVIAARAAGHDVTVSVEATRRGRKATVEWVEQMLAKHEHLPTDKLVLVSAAGFSEGAGELAEASGAVALAPEDVGADDPAYEIVNRLKSLWPKEVMFRPKSAKIAVLRSGSGAAWFNGTPDMLLFLDNGTEAGTLDQAVVSSIQANQGVIAEEIGLAQMAEDVETEFVLQIGSLEMPWTTEVKGERRQLFVRWDPDSGPSESQPIVGAQVVGDASVRIGEIPLHHGRLGEVMFSYGEGQISDRPVLAVATEGEAGGKLTIRARPKRA